MDLAGTFAGSPLRTMRVYYEASSRCWSWQIVTADMRSHAGGIFPDQMQASRNLVLTLTTRRSAAKPEDGQTVSPIA